MIEKQLQRIREGFQRRREAISEIHFTYKRLHGILSLLIKRVGAPMAQVLQRQQHEDRVINERLVQVALQHGQPPGPSACIEASALVEEVRHAERFARYIGGASVVISTLKEVRIFLIRAWGRLIDELTEEDLPEFRKEAIALQQREADQHRELVSLLLGMDDTDQRRAGVRSTG